ncbi:MAG: hypothetical protein ABSG81_02600 [Acidimicrobiales bacterium]
MALVERWPSFSSRAVVAIVLLVGILLVAEPAASAAPPVLAAGGTLVVPGGALNFGHAVAISGTTAIVGAPDNGSVPGTSYIYVKPKNGPWPAAPSFTLQDPANTPGDNFGVSVAISGGYAIVGAEGTSSLAGVAYIYKRAGQVWPTTPTDTLTYPSPAPGDQFGISVAISGTTAVVGTGNYAPEGAAFIYRKVGLVWLLQSTVTDSSAIPSWGFGQPVAISSNTVVVAAFGAKTGSCSTAPCGAVDVYVKPNNGWAATSTPTATLSDPAGLQNDYFGYSIAISGPTIVSGDYNAGPPAAGPVYIFDRPFLGWSSTSTPTQTLSDPAPLTNDSFGLSVAISGNTAIVGAYSASFSLGDAYVYKKAATWPTVPTVSKNPWPVPAGTGFFGIAVAISGSTAIVGGPAGFGDTYIFNRA